MKTVQQHIDTLLQENIVDGQHQQSDYFRPLQKLVAGKAREKEKSLQQVWQNGIDHVYGLLRDEILTSKAPPRHKVKFGTSGWRGMLGKDLTVRSVALVSSAILSLYQQAETQAELQEALGVDSFAEMQERGCVLGFDNRFGGPEMAQSVAQVLAAHKVRILYAGESTTGILSALVQQTKAAFSINLTPSHNPMEYGGFKYNAADAGPAAPILTNSITSQVHRFLQGEKNLFLSENVIMCSSIEEVEGLVHVNDLAHWQAHVRAGQAQHGLDYDDLLTQLGQREDIFLCIDAVHGASRNLIAPLLGNPGPEKITILRQEADPTFGGIAPEPSSENMQPTMHVLADKKQPLKIGAIIDPDGDRIRFTDGEVEISMNQFGAMAYHFLHEVNNKQGMVAKTVASSNLANALALAFNEDVFEPAVGFKEFKPVIDKALVFFEESDGISIIGHTPEKDAFIGLILALAMVLTRNISLGSYLQEIEAQFGRYYPGRGSIPVSQQGESLLASLQKLDQYTVGDTVCIQDGQGQERKKIITEILTIDGHKIIFSDKSWVMIRPSGTEPKIRYYVEARNPAETDLLIKIAQSMLAQIGLLQ